ncbi:MAG: amidohydrolase family protein [Promethearchaeota archaeon]
MEKLIIRNGLVFDPLNKINGEIKDIIVESGKVVEKLSNEKNVKEINAKGKTIIPAAIDIHTHVASQQVNWVRLLGSKNTTFKKIWHGLTLNNITKNYVSNGYTLIIEANVFPSLAKQTIFNFKQLPVLDKGMLLNVGNFWPLELEFQRGKIKEMVMFLSDLLKKTKAFGLKIYNPFENESWNFKELRDDISHQGRLYNFSALDVYENLIKSNELLGLPHASHLHIEAYEHEIGKNNLYNLLEKLKLLNIEINQNLTRDQVVHIAHANAYNYDGKNEKLVKLLNETPSFGINLGFLGFNEINPFVSSDRRIISSMMADDSEKRSQKIIRSAVEFEGDSYVIMRKFNKKNYNDCILWANALDLALNINNKFQICFSLNFPNYANISDIPEIITWLVSKKARDDYMKDMNATFLKQNSLIENSKVLEFQELVIITRGAPAKVLGLENVKGNLSPGADADLNILDIDIHQIDISKNYQQLKNAFSNLEFVLKSGTIVKKQDELNLDPLGSILWSNGKGDIEGSEYVIGKKKEFYQKYSSSFYESLEISVDDKLLRKIN